MDATARATVQVKGNAKSGKGDVRMMGSVDVKTKLEVPPLADLEKVQFALEELSPRGGLFATEELGDFAESVLDALEAEELASAFEEDLARVSAHLQEDLSTADLGTSLPKLLTSLLSTWSKRAFAVLTVEVEESIELIAHPPAAQLTAEGRKLWGRHPAWRILALYPRVLALHPRLGAVCTFLHLLLNLYSFPGRLVFTDVREDAPSPFAWQPASWLHQGTLLINGLGVAALLNLPIILSNCTKWLVQGAGLQRCSALADLLRLQLESAARRGRAAAAAEGSTYDDISAKEAFQRMDRLIERRAVVNLIFFLVTVAVCCGFVSVYYAIFRPVHR